MCKCTGCRNCASKKFPSTSVPMQSTNKSRKVPTEDQSIIIKSKNRLKDLLGITKEKTVMALITWQIKKKGCLKIPHKLSKENMPRSFKEMCDSRNHKRPCKKNILGDCPQRKDGYRQRDCSAGNFPEHTKGHKPKIGRLTIKFQLSLVNLISATILCY
eukprot:TRINITY_DN9327_c0_g1_i2.p2 TRINITY_DN9327_c0_g1~~TRINITY_DN9327_c0_g1_i2.p2  ORF type:complete len:159 (+),score=6.65 TRINITY_DN9327_c0_g1_i2:239-715(+)